MVSPIDGRSLYNKGANETDKSSAEKKNYLYDNKEIEDPIKENIYTGDDNSNNYRLKYSSLNFLTLDQEDITEDNKEYGNDEFDHMIKTLYIIQYNNNGAGEKYNEITNGHYATDSIKTIFSNLINFMKKKGLDRPSNRAGEYTNADFLYMVALGQALVIKEKQDSRTDKSADKVSDNFGDNILGFKSMSDFQTMDFSNYTEGNSVINETTSELAELEGGIGVGPEENTEDEEAEDNVKSQETTNGVVNEKNEENEENDKNTEETIEESNEETTEELSNIKVEKIGDREFPRIRDVYKHGNEMLLFDKNDLSDRGLSDKFDYIPSMYKSLNLDRNLDNPIEAEDLKEFLIKPWFKQLDKVIDDMEDGISVDGEKYKFTPEQIKEAIKNEGFIKTIKKDGKEYEIVFDTWTPEMKKISNSVRPLGDKEYQKTEGKSGSVKEKYQIEPVGLIYNKVNGIFNTDKKIGKISVGNRVLKQTN